MSIHETILPDGWKEPIGYANGILAKPGKTLYMAGQVGWDAEQKFHSEEIVPQFEQALKNILTIVKKAGGKPEHICRMTCFCKDKAAYMKGRKELGKIWQELMDKHYPAMSMIFVVDLLDHPGIIEIEATAIIPE